MLECHEKDGSGARRLCNQLHTARRRTVVEVSDDREIRAAKLLGAAAYDYFAGGAGEERVLRENVEAWADHRLAPRVLVDVSEIDTSVTVLGRRWPHPVGVAPMAYMRHAHPDGEAALGRAAAASGAMLTLSTQTTTPPADVAAGMGDAGRWFQLYVFRDRAVTDDLVAAAREGGFELWSSRSTSRWAARAIAAPVSCRPTRRWSIAWPRRTGSPSPWPSATRCTTPSLTWDDIAGFAEASGLPVVIKGVLRPEDARRAVGAGRGGRDRVESRRSPARRGAAAPPMRSRRSSTRWPAAPRCWSTAASGAGGTWPVPWRSAPMRCWWAARCCGAWPPRARPAPAR